MKKITSFLTLALLFGGISSADAQRAPELSLPQLVTVSEDAVQSFEDLDIVDEDTKPSEGWYVILQGRGGDGYMSDRVDMKGGSVVRQPADIYVEENTFTTTFAPALVRIVPGSRKDTYRIMFGTGRYISSFDTPTVPNGTRLDAGSLEDAADLFIYVTETDGTLNDGCFAINFVDDEDGYGFRVDTDAYSDNLDEKGRLAAVTKWNDGLNTLAEDNSIWTIYPVALEEADDWAIAVGEMRTILNEYQNKAAEFDNKTSEDGSRGTYSKKLFDAFMAAVNHAFDIDIEPESYEIEEIRAAGQAIIDTYNAAKESYVSTVIGVKPGYYFIATPKVYNGTITVPGEGEDAEPVQQQIKVNKYMYSKSSPAGIEAFWGDMAENNTKATFLWKISDSEKGEMKYRVENAGTDATFCQAMPAMSTESDSLIQFDYMRTAPGNTEAGESDTIFYSLRLAHEAGNIGNSFNQHLPNAQRNDSVVDKWAGGQYHWALIPVEEADAQAIIAAYSDTKADVELQNEANRILSVIDAKLEIARDRVDYDNPLIKSVDQLSSPFTQGTDKEPDSGLDKLIDNNPDTYWHSLWDPRPTSTGTHYLQVSVPDLAETDELCLRFTRRNNSGNQVTEFSVYGYNDDDESLTKEDGELLATLSTPFKSQTETIDTEAFPSNGYSFFRFYAEKAAPANNGFWHAAEIQLFKRLASNSTSQAIGMGDVFKNMEAAVEAAREDGDVISKEHCQALIAAYEAFSKIYVNPDTLRHTIKDNAKYPSYVVVKEGDQPGYWSDENAKNALSAAIAAANDYDKAGKYTPAQSTGHVKAIEDAKEALFAAANKVKTGKWYNFRFASEDLYTDNEWSKSGADARTYDKEHLEMYPKDDNEQWPALFGKYISIGKEVAHYPDTTYTYVAEELENVALGQNLYFLDEGEITDADAAMFRFIPSGDTAYIIQNKATGLYLRAAGGSGLVTLSIQPTLWKNEAMGYGKVMSTGNDILGRNNNQLHAQRDKNILCTWGATGVESNTGFFIEEVENVAADYAKNDFKMSLNPNAIYGFCYPMDVTPAAGKSVYGVAIEGEAITLTVFKDNVAKAGTPFIYITGMEEAQADDEEEEIEQELHDFTYGGTLNVKADTVGRHIGSYFATTAPKGSIIATGTGKFVAVKTDTNIGANSTWINAQLENPKEADVTYTINEDGVFDAIKDAVANVNKTGKIYNVDGTYVGKGDINTVKGLKKGLYIINGVKVLVK